MSMTDANHQAPNQAPSGRRARVWVAVAIALVVIAVIAIASGAFGDFTGGFSDGLKGQTRPDAAGSR